MVSVLLVDLPQKALVTPPIAGSEVRPVCVPPRPFAGGSITRPAELSAGWRRPPPFGVCASLSALLFLPSLLFTPLVVLTIVDQSDKATYEKKAGSSRYDCAKDIPEYNSGLRVAMQIIWNPE